MNFFSSDLDLTGKKIGDKYILNVPSLRDHT